MLKPAERSGKWLIFPTEAIWFGWIFPLKLGMSKRVKDRLSLFHPKNTIKKTQLALCCPITSNRKAYPFEVVLREQKIKGVILSDHLKSLDWKVRKAKFIEQAKTQTVSECMEKIMMLVMG